MARTLERYRHHAPGGHSYAQRPPPPRGERVERTAGASKAAGFVRHGVGDPRGVACRPHRPGGCSVRASGAAGGGFAGRRGDLAEIAALGGARQAGGGGAVLPVTRAVTLCSNRRAAHLCNALARGHIRARLRSTLRRAGGGGLRRAGAGDKA